MRSSASLPIQPLANCCAMAYTSGVPQVSPRPVMPFSSVISITVRSVFWITYIEPACTMVSGIETRARRIEEMPIFAIEPIGKPAREPSRFLFLVLQKQGLKKHQEQYER